MLKQGGCVIINMASVSSHRAFSELSPYNASKHEVEKLDSLTASQPLYSWMQAMGWDAKVKAALEQ